MTSVQLSLPGFGGPAADLLAEIEGGRQPIEDLAVAEVTRQFLSWVRENDDADLLAVGELLRTGARLAALKSGRLLQHGATETEPEIEALDTDEEPADREIFRSLAGRLAEEQGAQSFVAQVSADLVPRRVEPRSPLALVTSLTEMSRRQQGPPARLPLPSFVRLEVAVSSLIRRLKAGTTLSLRRLLRRSTRQDAVVHFIAVLELIRRRQAVAHQPVLFDDIRVEWVEQPAEAESSRAG